MILLDRSITTLTTLAESHRIQSMRAELASDGIRIELDSMAYTTGRMKNDDPRLNSIHRFERSLHQCMSCHHESDVQAELESTQAMLGSYLELIQETQSVEAPQKVYEVREKMSGLSDMLSRKSGAMSERARRHLAVRSSDAAASVGRAWTILSLTLFATVVFGGIVAFHLKSRLTRPIEGLLAGIERMRKGDPSYRISVEADEEFRSLAEAFNQANEDLKKAQENVLQAEKMAAVGKMAAGVAHEVGNPLASISSIAQMMIRNSDDGQQMERTSLILEEVKRISGIIQSLLAFSKPPGDESFRSVDIAELLNRATSLMRFDKRAALVEIRSELDEGLGIVHGDPDRLLSVFTNIILNASDAISSADMKAGILTITARGEGEHLIVRFEDNGPGMNEDQLANAFEPFFTTKEPGQGTGLGLWICYQEIQRQGGTIRIESREGEGTVATIVLPRSSGAPVDDTGTVEI
jgi:signal transduction histidine kinase